MRRVMFENLSEASLSGTSVTVHRLRILFAIFENTTYTIHFKERDQFCFN